MQPAANLAALDRAALEDFFARMGEKRFHAGQALRWIYQRRVTAPDAFTDLSKALRARLNRDAAIEFPAVAARRRAADGTRKWLLRLADGNAVETVFIPEAGRGTLCVSSQVGCGLNCTFCATARHGYNRNLTVDEIIGQVWVAAGELAGDRDIDGDGVDGDHGDRDIDGDGVDGDPGDGDGDHGRGETKTKTAITNIVLMGMGEPLLNFDAVVAALRLMLDDCAFGLSKRRVTLSTAGLVPAIDRLASACPVSLAVSLHAPDDALREQLVPLNKKYPIAELLAACRRYAAARPRTRITFEYVLLAGVNDSSAQARALAKLLGDMPAKINLIPFNPSPDIDYRRPSPAAVERFRDILIGRNLFTVTRKTRGDDIDAACGQLAGKFTDRTRRSRRWVSAPAVPAPSPEMPSSRPKMSTPSPAARDETAPEPAAAAAG
ncbi:MAG: radical SAM protein [Gammaproteobacteria bacterium]|nr:radical SAM protein [Gammaproteobacteria bacterium]